MELYCDLHTHSTCSDGTSTPEELIREAERLGLAAVALCDHNTVAGLPEFLEAARSRNVTAVPGIEFSADYQGREVHILGLFIQPEDYPAVTDKVDEMMRRKDESNRLLVSALSRAGISLDYGLIRSRTPNGQVNRALIAAEMVRLGYCETIQDAFRGWLHPRHGYYQPPARLDAMDVIRFIRSMGAVSVLAHPLLNLEGEQLRRFLEEAVRWGLDGMEVLYSKFTPEQTETVASLAREFGLCFSGGSDFHGENKPDIRMGTGRGDLRIPVAYYQALAEKGPVRIDKAEPCVSGECHEMSVVHGKFYADYIEF